MRIVVSLLGSVVLAGVCVAQSAQSPSGASASQAASSAAQAGASASASQTGKVAEHNAQLTSSSPLQAGTTMQAELVKPVDARKNKPGDEVIAKTTSDVKSEGHVVVPKGSKVVGHITDVKAHSKGQATSELGIVFDHAILKSGTQIPLSLSIQAIGASRASTAAAAEDSAMASGNAGTVGPTGGRASGGLLGGATSTVGGVVNTAGSAAGGVVNTAGTAGGAASGSLTAHSQGVVGLPGLSLATGSSASANASVISSQGSNVSLASGTEMILRVN